MPNQYKTIKKGSILIAEPFMQDFHFRRSVVLVCSHNDKQQGSVGFILNKKLDKNINAILESLPEIDACVYYGGPMETGTVHYVHTAGEFVDDSVELVDGLYWGGNFDQIKTLINQKVIGPEDIRFYVGYSAWGAGQLKEEMEIKSWVVSKINYDYLFNINSQNLWSKSLFDLGGSYSVISKMKENLNKN